MKKTLSLTLLSPEASAEEHTVLKATFPGEAGSFTVLPMHASMIATLSEGDVVFTREDEVVERVHIKSGVMKVSKDRISVCFEK